MMILMLNKRSIRVATFPSLCGRFLFSTWCPGADRFSALFVADRVCARVFMLISNIANITHCVRNHFNRLDCSPDPGRFSSWTHRGSASVSSPNLARSTSSRSSDAPPPDHQDWLSTIFMIYKSIITKFDYQWSWSCLDDIGSMESFFNKGENHLLMKDDRKNI